MKRYIIIGSVFIVGFVGYRLYINYKRKKAAGRLGNKFGKLGRELLNK
tara:strand:+ start:471 stop:614 length:144 start_codon:yes stop_codon:yes gene_type:complete